MAEPPTSRRLSELKAAPKNPRKITPKGRKMLKKALDAFGDLGGVVFNRKSGHLVGGHARVDAIRQMAGAKVVITRKLEQPDAQGTVADGYIEAGGEHFYYREVEFDPQTEALANLAANKSAGSFDAVLLADTLKGLSMTAKDLELSMFDADELRGYLPKVEEASSTVEPFEQLPEERFGGEHGENEDVVDAQAERVRGATAAPDAPAAQGQEVPAMRQITLTFRAAEMEKFQQLVDALKDIYHVSNVSDVVLEAVKRASVKAAFA